MQNNQSMYGMKVGMCCWSIIQHHYLSLVPQYLYLKHHLNPTLVFRHNCKSIIQNSIFTFPKISSLYNNSIFFILTTLISKFTYFYLSLLLRKQIICYKMCTTPPNRRGTSVLGPFNTINKVGARPLNIHIQIDRQMERQMDVDRQIDRQMAVTFTIKNGII